MNFKTTIQVRPDEFTLSYKSHDVKSVYAIGTAVADNVNEDSCDMDLLVELNTEDPIKRGQNLLDL